MQYFRKKGMANGGSFIVIRCYSWTSSFFDMSSILDYINLAW